MRLVIELVRVKITLRRNEREKLTVGSNVIIVHARVVPSANDEVDSVSNNDTSQVSSRFVQDQTEAEQSVRQ